MKKYVLLLISLMCFSHIIAMDKDPYDLFDPSLSRDEVVERSKKLSDEFAKSKLLTKHKHRLKIQKNLDLLKKHKCLPYISFVHEAPIVSIDFGSDNCSILTASKDGVVKVWTLYIVKPYLSFNVLKDSSEEVSSNFDNNPELISAIFHPKYDTCILTTDSTGKVKKWYDNNFIDSYNHHEYYNPVVMYPSIFLTYSDLENSRNDRIIVKTSSINDKGEDESLYWAFDDDSLDLDLNYDEIRSIILDKKGEYKHFFGECDEIICRQDGKYALTKSGNVAKLYLLDIGYNDNTKLSDLSSEQLYFLRDCSFQKPTVANALSE